MMAPSPILAKLRVKIVIPRLVSGQKFWPR